MYITMRYNLFSICMRSVGKFKINAPFVHSRILIRVVKVATPMYKKCKRV